MIVFAKFRLLAVAGLIAALPLCADAQISFTSAVDLALRNSPRVRSASAQVDHAKAELSASKDAYIPSVSAGAAIGEAFGYSPYPPTLFTINAGSLVFDYAQKDYIRSASAGLKAAQLALQDVREAVAEDTALTFVALDHDQQREDVLKQQFAFANKLVDVTQERYDAGYDPLIDLLMARQTAKQLQLNMVHNETEIATDRQHLAGLIGVPAGVLRAEGGFPEQAFPPIDSLELNDSHAPAIAAGFASAKARQEQAFGEKRFLYRPQVNLIVQYNHYATFANSFRQLKNLYPNISNDDQVYGLQITIPLFDKVRQNRARETAADAVKALNDAQNAQLQIFDAQTRLKQSLTELQIRADLASLGQQIAQQQLQIVQVQMAAPTGNGPNAPVATPKDEQNALIGERDKYLTVIDTTFQLRQAEISLLRQTGRLQDWLTSLIPVAPGAAVTAPPKP